MGLLRAISYFLNEALTSLWRSRLVNAVSVGTIAVSLFVLGAFLTVASALSSLVTRWTETVQVIVYLDDGALERVLASLENRLRADPAVGKLDLVTREQALARFRSMFRDLCLAARGPGREPVPGLARAHAAPEARRRRPTSSGSRRPSPACPACARSSTTCCGSSGSRPACAWCASWGRFLGGILVLAAVFTISNVIRLTIYAREDELDIMRLVGATRAYVKGPFVTEGVIQGGLGGLVASLLLWSALAWLSRDLATSDLLPHARSASRP